MLPEYWVFVWAICYFGIFTCSHGASTTRHPNARFLDHGTREEIQSKYWPGNSSEDAKMRAMVPFINYAPGQTQGL